MLFLLYICAKPDFAARSQGDLALAVKQTLRGLLKKCKYYYFN